MTLAVNHDIAIVPVLDLQDVTSNRIRGHGLNEVQTRALEFHGIFATISGNEEIQQVVDFCPSHFVPGCRVRNDVYDTALRITVSLAEVLERW